MAFDGDADRVGVVTNNGEMITPDRLLMFFATDILQRNPGAIIPFDVKCTRHLGEQIAKHGGKPLMGQTGHSLVKAKMKETGAPIAGEFSGYIFFKERWYGFDNGIYSATRLVELLAKNSKSCAKIFAALPNSINIPELKIPVADDKKFAFMKKLVEDAHFENAKITTIDGLRVDFKDGFGLARPSNTKKAKKVEIGEKVEEVEKAKMTDEEWEHLHENFDTYLLLDAVGHIDEARYHLGDGENWEPPQIRTDLLKMHQLAMDVINNGWTKNAQELFDMAMDAEMEIYNVIERLKAVQKTLRKLTDLYPDSLMED